MKRALAVVVVAFSVLVTGAAAKPAPNVAVFAARSDITGGFNITLECCNDVWSSSMGSIEALHGAFVEDARGEWVKDLVTSATADRRGITYTIRPDAFWYWGGRKIPVTYRDFLYTLRKIDDPASDVVTRTGYANLDPAHVVHHGERRVTFFWRTASCSADHPCAPYAAWPTLFAQLYPSFALRGADFNKIWTDCICGSDGKPVADGPFYLARYTPGQGTVLKANPYYHDRAKLDEVDFKVLADDALEREAIRDGQVDAINPSFGPDLAGLRTVRGLKYYSAPIDALEYLVLRQGSAKGGPTVTKGGSNVLLRAPWMRQAIAFALDRQGMIDAVYGAGSGLKPQDNLLIYPGEAGYRPDFARWTYAPARALAILAKHCSGGPSVPDSATTKTWHCAGLPALFGYSWPSAGPARTTIEQVAKANLRAVGIAIDDRPLSNSTVFSPTDGIPSGGFDLAQFAEFTSGDPGDWYDSYRCSGAENYTGFCSHRVDRLLTAANAALDPERRAALFGQADTILAAELPAIPLFQKPGALVRKSGLLGLGPNPGSFGPFWNIQDWHWKR
jgi:ABC-type transport system substrate-binding protein